MLVNIEDIKIEKRIRKDFTKLERLDWARQLERIERVKAKERMGQGVENFPQLKEGKARDFVAEKTGIGSGRQYEKEKSSETRLLRKYTTFLEIESQKDLSA